jgi:hypothetical protein
MPPTIATMMMTGFQPCRCVRLFNCRMDLDWSDLMTCVSGFVQVWFPGTSFRWSPPAAPPADVYPP